MHLSSNSVRGRPGSISIPTFKRSQTVRAQGTADCGRSYSTASFSLLPRRFRDHGSSFSASFEFRQSLGFPQFFRPSPITHLTQPCLRRAALYPAELRVHSGSEYDLEDEPAGKPVDHGFLAEAAGGFNAEMERCPSSPRSHGRSSLPVGNSRCEIRLRHEFSRYMVTNQARRRFRTNAGFAQRLMDAGLAFMPRRIPGSLPRRDRHRPCRDARRWAGSAACRRCG